MNVPTSLALLGVLFFTVSFIDPSEPLRCLSLQCISPDSSEPHCQHLVKDRFMILDGCESCGESFTKDPLNKLVVLRTCELDPCMNGVDGTVHVKGAGTFASIRCCHEDLCNNGTMPAIPFHEGYPDIEGVENMKQIKPGDDKH